MKPLKKYLLEVGFFMIKKRTEKKIEIINESNIVGVKFKVVGNDKTVFKVKSIRRNKVTITWSDISLNEKNINYTVEYAISYFAKGDWIKIKQIN